MASKQSKWHGRIEGARDRCGAPGCKKPGEFKAPLTPSSFNGPGRWRFLCLEHVREHNASYNYFEGMSAEEITEAQSPLAGWERSTRVFFSSAGGDPPPAWSDFSDPLDAIAGRFRAKTSHNGQESRFNRAERRALGVLGLGEDADRAALRKRYSLLVRRYHPDKNGGDRTHEVRLGEVIEAYQLLRRAAAFG